MLAIETILGALTGYFTNDIAIRQLFSKNGVVVHEREQFTTLIVQVLKEKIIDEETMEGLCQRDEIIRFFEMFVHELLVEAVPMALAERSLSDFDDGGGLRNLLKSHVDAASMEDMELDVMLLYRHLDGLIQSSAFQDKVMEGLQQLAVMSLQDLGLGKSIERCFAPIMMMDEDDWQEWLEDQRAKIMMMIDCAEESDDERQLGVLLSLDGEQVVQKIESYFGMDFSQTHQVEAFAKGCIQAFEQLYVFAARVLPKFLEAHLPALFEVFYPMLAEDRAWIERMVLESIEECNTDGNMILSVAAGYIENFFTGEEDGIDWLSKWYAQCFEPEGVEAVCIRLADFICGLIMRQIDEWRRLQLESDEGVERAHIQYLQWRGVLVKFLDAYLALPVDNKVHRALLKGAVSEVVHWLQHRVTVETIQQWCETKQQLWCAQSLQLLGFNEKRQQWLLDEMRQWWHEKGREWLEAHVPSESALKRGLCEVIDSLFSKPMGEVLGRVQALIPYEPIADALRMAFFEHLRDFLANLTREQLEALSHEDIREVVLDMIGREMRPLAYLGGGIGAAAGIATGAAMQASGFSVDPDQMALLLAARSGMYGAVGYGTNVMAVKGLFWPYKKTMGVQGLICKNQSRFADKMKSMAENYVINNDIWMQQVQMVSEHVAKHYDDILRYGLHMMKENREKSLRPYVEMATEQMPHQLCGLIFDKVQATGWMQSLTAKGIETTLQRPYLVEAAQGLQLFHRGVCKLAMMEATNRRLSEKLVCMAQSMAIDDWVALGNRCLAQWRGPADYTTYHRIWQRLTPYYQQLPKTMMNYSADIARVLGQYVQRHLTLPLQLVYRMAGGERQIERVVRHFVTYKLPAYIAARESQVEERFVKWAQAQFTHHSLLDSGVCFSEAQGQWVAERMEKCSVDAVHTHLLSLFVWLEKIPKEFERTMLESFLKITKPLLDLLGPVLTKAAEDDVVWQELGHALAPMFDYLQMHALEDISVDALLSVKRERLWMYLEAIMTVNEVEKTVIIETTQAMWSEIAPIFWQVIGQRGRELLMMVDVPTLTHDRICALSPQELEVMVRDIAQPYFTRVERMGWLGAVVAVPATMVSMLLGGM